MQLTSADLLIKKNHGKGSLLAEVSQAEKINESRGERPLPASDEFSVAQALAFP